MEIKKGNRFVCTDDVVMEGVHEHVAYIKGNVYISERDNCITNERGNSGHIWKDDGEEKHFIPYSKLDRVYTKYTERLEKLFDDYKGKKYRTSSGEILFFDNCDASLQTGYFCATNTFEEYYESDNFTYLSEQAFIEFMGLLPEQDNYTSMAMYLKSEKSDLINKPSHYNNGSIEPIDYITANSMNFLEGNVVKYVTRYKFKNGLEDLKKAEFYLKRLIEEYKS